MGMLATVMNGPAMRDALHRAYVNARLMSAIPLNGVRQLQLGRSYQPVAQQPCGDPPPVQVTRSLPPTQQLACVVSKLKPMWC